MAIYHPAALLSPLSARTLSARNSGRSDHLLRLERREIRQADMVNDRLLLRLDLCPLVLAEVDGAVAQPRLPARLAGTREHEIDAVRLELHLHARVEANEVDARS